MVVSGRDSVNEGLSNQDKSIDDVRAALGNRFGLLHLDLEGAEHHALAGAEKTLQKDGPVVVTVSSQRSTGALQASTKPWLTTGTRHPLRSLTTASSGDELAALYACL